MQELVAAVCYECLNNPLQQVERSADSISLSIRIRRCMLTSYFGPRRIKLPVSTPTACAFAGTDLSVLYITTLDDKSESKGTGGLWSYELPGLSGWSASYVAKPL